MKCFVLLGFKMATVQIFDVIFSNETHGKLWHRTSL